MIPTDQIIQPKARCYGDVRRIGLTTFREHLRLDVRLGN
jgi:hypothetical protein